jgi:signal transduction histidine kinase
MSAAKKPTRRAAGMPTPAEAALSLFRELAAIALIEGSAALALGTLAGGMLRTTAPWLAALMVAIGSGRAIVAASAVTRQGLLHRAGSGADDAPSPPSSRALEAARRLPLAVAVLAVCAAPVALAIGSRPALLAIAIATIAIAPVDAAVRRAIEPWIAQLPHAELRDPRLLDVLVDRAIVVGAPSAGVALGALALGAPVWSLAALIPTLVHAGIALASARRTREELDHVAEHVEHIDPDTSRSARVIELRTPAAREAWAHASEMLSRASVVLRTDSDAQERIEHEDRVRSRFTAAMGHELRSPLNSIVGFAQLLEDGADGPLTGGQHESVVLIRRSAQDLLRLLTDILDSARLESGRLKMRRTWTPSVEIVSEAVRLGRSIVEGQDIAIEAHIQPGLPPVHVDRERIVQAVVATFRHAARGKGGGTIEVRAHVGRARDGRNALLVEVRDAGRTLQSAELESVFDSFRDLREPTGRRIGGLGLALALARKLVRYHGGDVWAETRERGGTRYVVALALEPRGRGAP